MRKFIKESMQRFGYDILHLPTNPTARDQMHLLRENSINLIFDVGANAGQYAQKMRGLGYKGNIVSFEPVADTYQLLERNTSEDNLWRAVHSGIGDFDGTTEINISANTYSSSIMDMLPLHLESAPDAAYTSKETIQVQKIDTLLDQYYTPQTSLYVKIDTQGFERQVFEGCKQSLDKIKGFQMELSLHPLYEGEVLMHEMVKILQYYGYKLKVIEGGYRNCDTGELLQVEGYFFK